MEKGDEIAALDHDVHQSRGTASIRSRGMLRKVFEEKRKGSD
jgi:hypothetical protein